MILLAGASPVALAGSSTRRAWGEVGGRPARLDLAAEASLVEFLWRAAPQCSLVHDVSHGGLAVALAEAALHSGIGAEVDAAGRPARLVRRGRRPGGARLRARGRRPGSAACRSGGLGVVGGSGLLGSGRRAGRGRPPTGDLDVRRLRHPLGRARRGPALVLRPLRAPAPRPGGGRDRRLRPRPSDRAPRHGPRGAGLRRGEAAGASRRGRDRAHALLDDRLERTGRTRNRSSTTAAPGRSRSATTAT